MDPVLLAIAVAVGLLIGILSGMLGIGGGTVMVPMFKLGFGMSAIGATATSLFAIIPTALAGAFTHLRQKTCIPLLGVLAGVGGACTSPLGVYLASLSPGWAIMLAAAVVILYSSARMLSKARKLKEAADEVARPADSAGARAGARAEDPAPAPVHLPTSRLWLGVPIGAVAGLVAGYVGVGGGFLMVPLFIAVLGLSMKQASGSSLVAIAILAIPGAATQLYLGNVEIAIALAILLGSIPGAAVGARFAARMPERHLRLLFGGALALCAIAMVLQELV